MRKHPLRLFPPESPLNSGDFPCIAAVSYTHLDVYKRQAPASFQFMRLGYFCLDSKDSKPGHLVFNRSVSLKDSFKK